MPVEPTVFGLYQMVHQLNFVLSENLKVLKKRKFVPPRDLINKNNKSIRMILCELRRVFQELEAVQDPERKRAMLFEVNNKFAEVVPLIDELEESAFKIRALYES